MQTFEDSVNKIWSNFMKNLLSFACVAVCLCGVVFQQSYSEAAATNNHRHAHFASKEVSAEEINKILTYADAELDSASTFLTGLDDIELILAQEDVIYALKNNNKVESRFRQLKLPTKIATLLKKAYKATRATNGAGVEHKADVARLLVTVHGIWSDEDALQKLNYERWSDELFDDINAGSSKHLLQNKITEIARDKKVEDKNNASNKMAIAVNSAAAHPHDIDNFRNVTKTESKTKRRVLNTKNRSSKAESSKAQEPAKFVPRKKTRKSNTSDAAISTEKTAKKAFQLREKKVATTKTSNVESSTAAKPRRRQAQTEIASEAQPSLVLDRPKPAKNVDSEGRKPRTEKTTLSLSRDNEKAAQKNDSSSTGAVRSN